MRRIPLVIGLLLVTACRSEAATLTPTTTVAPTTAPTTAAPFQTNVVIADLCGPRGARGTNSVGLVVVCFTFGDGSNRWIAESRTTRP